MKKIIYPIVIVFGLILLSAIPINNTHESSIQGVWELVDRYTYDGNQITDTIKNTNGYRQIKMYSNDKVMWTRFVPLDSVEWFGYGSYYTKDSSLVETLEYGSNSMMKIIDTMRKFKFKLMIDHNTYSQITLDNDGNPMFSENYRRLE